MENFKFIQVPLIIRDYIKDALDILYSPIPDNDKIAEVIEILLCCLDEF